MAYRRNASIGCRLRPLLLVGFASLVLTQHVAFASAAAKSSWLTLTASAPKVVARGGLSGLFPDSSILAYNMAQLTSTSDLVLWCDIHLTKDGAGICFPSIKLENSSAILTALPGAKKSTYLVNGVPVAGYFSIDYTLEQLSNVTLTQGIYSRPPNFDGCGVIVTPQTVFNMLQPAGFWLNVQHDAFYRQHKLSTRDFILGASMKNVPFNYLSSPELQFLKDISPSLGNETKMIFRFMGQGNIEPTTKQTYGSLLNNLAFIKNFADGILVPKTYIWPQDSSLYLLPATMLVHDAHKAGLLIFAADFANDNIISYNYSYNPVAEYIQFIDNGDFSIDGVLTDFPQTPSEAISCFAHMGNNATVKVSESPLVISNNGASGDYPGCTDLAYWKAISDGADVIDCNVQMSKDGIPFCLSSVNLIDSTTILQSDYYKQMETIPELQAKSGIFTFRLTWQEIQGLTCAISNQFLFSYNMVRNPKFKNAGRLVSLFEFLAIAENASSLSSALIKIENADYLAEKQRLNVIDAVKSVFESSGYSSNQIPLKLMIQSTNSAVLKAFKGKRSYELVYKVDEQILDVLKSTAELISDIASSVVVSKSSIYPLQRTYTFRLTDVVKKFHAFNLTVYTEVFANEFVSQAWDFFSDPILEINSFVQGAGIDGIVTEFPHTAVLYKKNRCISVGKDAPAYMQTVQPGGLLQLMTPGNMPPDDVAPVPALSEVIDRLISTSKLATPGIFNLISIKSQELLQLGLDFGGIIIQLLWLMTVFIIIIRNS